MVPDEDVERLCEALAVAEPLVLLIGYSHKDLEEFKPVELFVRIFVLICPHLFYVGGYEEPVDI